MTGKDKKFLKKWLEGRTITEYKFNKRLGLLVLALDDDTALVVQTENFGRAVKQDGKTK